ncbi:transposase [Gammaproteobacteria bacterium]
MTYLRRTLSFTTTLLIDRIDQLRLAFSYVKERHPFRIDAVVILPDHLHCIWTLIGHTPAFING